MFVQESRRFDFWVQTVSALSVMINTHYVKLQNDSYSFKLSSNQRLFFSPPALTAAMKDAGMRWKAPRVLKLDQWLSSFYGRFFFLELSITNANDAKWQEKCTYSERIKLCFHSPWNNYNCALYYTGCIHASSLNVTRTSWIRGHKISTNTTSV